MLKNKKHIVIAIIASIILVISLITTNKTKKMGLLFR